MEKAILYVKDLYITQKMNENFSHLGEYAIDISSKSEFLASPFTGIIKKIYPSCNAVWLESVNKVLFADGTKDYATILVIHNDDVSNLYVGKIIKQGDTTFYKPGNKGISTGTHIHLAVAKGKFTGSGWHKGMYQSKVKAYSYPINNQYPVNKLLFLDSRCKRSKSIYDWNIANINDKESSKYYDKCNNTYKSLVDALISIDVNASFENRKKIAIKNGITDYTGKAYENNKLLALLKKGLLLK